MAGGAEKEGERECRGRELGELACSDSSLGAGMAGGEEEEGKREEGCWDVAGELKKVEGELKNVAVT